MPVKTAKKSIAGKSKTAPPKKTAASSSVKRPVGRPRKNPEPVVVTAPEPEFELMSEEKHGKLRIAGMSYVQLAELSGIPIETEGFLIMLELLRGGRDRQEINDRVRDKLPRTTSSGTPKPVPNLVSGIMKRLEGKGFTVKGDWKMVKPSARV